MNTKTSKIYIVGHLKPDLDAIASALGYQRYMEGLGYTNYSAICCDKINPLTEWAFKKYDTPLPIYVNDISGMNVVLVDHTSVQSRAKGWECANILEVIDHHDVMLEDIIPQRITIRPCGSTSSLVTEMIFKSRVNISKNISCILLSAILDDTLGLKSPTTKKIDIDMVNWLNSVCKVKDIWEYSKELFEVKDIWNTLSPRDIIKMDIRELEYGNRWVSVSQVETLDNSKLNKKEILNELGRINSRKPYSLRLVMLTDLILNNCILLVVGDDLPLLQKKLNKKIMENTVLLPGVVSRKKQIYPILNEIYGK